MVAALKRGVAHGILKKSEGYYSLPTDTKSECLEVAAQELGLLDLCCRKKKRESRRKKGCKSVSSRRKKRASRRSRKSRMRGCKPRSGRGRSRRKSKSRSMRRGKSRRGKSRRGKSGRGCPCKTKRGGRSKRGRRSKRSKSRGCKPKRRARRPKRINCGDEEDQKPKGKQCEQFGIDVYGNDERELTDRHSRCRTKSRSRSCSRNRNVVSTAWTNINSFTTFFFTHFRAVFLDEFLYEHPRGSLFVQLKPEYNTFTLEIDLI